MVLKRISSTTPCCMFVNYEGSCVLSETTGALISVKNEVEEVTGEQSHRENVISVSKKSQQEAPVRKPNQESTQPIITKVNQQTTLPIITKVESISESEHSGAQCKECGILPKVSRLCTCVNGPNR